MPSPLLAFLIPSLAAGGAERVAVDLSGALAERGIRTEIVTVYKGAEGQLKPHRETTVVHLGAHRIATCVPALVKYLDRRQPDALISTLNHTNFAAVIASMFSRSATRLVIRQASTLSENVKRMRWPIGRCELFAARALYSRADLVVAVSRGVATDLQRQRVIDPPHVQVIYNPVVSTKMLLQAGEPVSHPWLGRKVPVILGVGRLSEIKDYPTLLRAFLRVRRQIDARLIILGEGPLRKPLENLVQQLGLGGYVDLPGFSANPFAYMARASLFVLSSQSEGLPNAQIQATALGVPVVATSCPSGPAEIVETTGWGRLVGVGDEVEMARAIVEELSSVETRRPPKLDAFRLETVIPQYLAAAGL